VFKDGSVLINSLFLQFRFQQKLPGLLGFYQPCLINFNLLKLR